MISTDADIPIIQEGCLLSIQELREKIDPHSFYAFLFFDLNARAYPDHFLEDFQIQITTDANNDKYIELHSLIIGKRLEWIRAKDYKDTYLSLLLNPCYA